MVWIFSIIKFVFAFIAVFSMCLFILSCISGIINPCFVVKDDKTIEKGANARYMFALIMAVSWAVVIALP